MNSKLQPAKAVLTLLAVVGTVLSSAGCHHSYYENARYMHCLDSCFARKRAAVQAWYVWLQCRDQCCSERVSDYRRGFIQGYCDVALGGSSCLPCVPPRRYWGWCYQNEKGQECVAAWYEGHPVGCAAATQVGCNYEIPTIVPEDPQYPAFQKEFMAACGENGCAPTPSGSDFQPVLPEEPQFSTSPTVPSHSLPSTPAFGGTEDVPARMLTPPLNPGYEASGSDLETDQLIKTPIAPGPPAESLDASSASFGEEDLLDTLEELDREARKIGK